MEPLLLTVEQADQVAGVLRPRPLYGRENFSSLFEMQMSNLTFICENLGLLRSSSLRLIIKGVSGS